jgi:hypothetical protein
MVADILKGTDVKFITDIYNVIVTVQGASHSQLNLSISVIGASEPEGKSLVDLIQSLIPERFIGAN